MTFRRAGACAVIVALFGVTGAALAQTPPRLAPDVPLTLRPTPAARRLAAGVARTLGLRLEVAVVVGEDAPPEILSAVPAGHVGIDREETLVRLVLAGPEGQVFRSEVAVAGPAGSGVVRAVALAIEALREAALEGPPPGSEPNQTFRSRDQDVQWTYLEPEGGLFGPRERTDALAKPILYLGVLGGLSTERLTALIGPRLGLGLCISDTCVILEGDLPVLPDVSTSCDGRQIEYRPVNLSLGVLLLPFRVGDFRFGFQFGVLTRFGLVNLVGVDASRLATDFGLRAGLETSWRFAAPVELVLEVGSDVHTSPAVFTRTTRPDPLSEPTCAVVIERVLVEDIVTAWGVLAVRIRP